MGYAAVDLRADADVEPFLAALGGASEGPVQVWVGEHGRITLFADHGNGWLGAALAAGAGALARGVLGLDHDEYGVEHAVVEGTADGLRRVHHVFVGPDDEGEPELTDLAARPGLHQDPDGTLPGPDARAAAAELFGVPSARMEAAAERSADAHERLGSVFTPLAPWWDALAVTYPIPNLGQETLVLGG